MTWSYYYTASFSLPLTLTWESSKRSRTKLETLREIPTSTSSASYWCMKTMRKCQAKSSTSTSEMLLREYTPPHPLQEPNVSLFSATSQGFSLSQSFLWYQYCKRCARMTTGSWKARFWFCAQMLWFTLTLILKSRKIKMMKIKSWRLQMSTASFRAVRRTIIRLRGIQVQPSSRVALSINRFHSSWLRLTLQSFSTWFNRSWLKTLQKPLLR